MQPQPAPAPALASLSNGLLRTVEGTVVATGPVRNNIETLLDEDDYVAAAEASPQLSQRIDLRVSSLEMVTDTMDRQIPVQGGIRLTIRWPSDALAKAAVPFRCGERIRADVRLFQPDTYHDPGVWSFKGYLLKQGITSTGGVRITRVERLGQARGAFLSCRIGALQHAVSSRLLALPAAMHRLSSSLRLSRKDAVMLAAMVSGDRTYLTHSLRVGFERTGSFHMLVVSGFHLAIVAGCIFWFTRRIRLSRVPATFLTIFVSFAYAIFTGFATPVQRSLWMVTLYLLGRLLYRERSPLNTIGFAALCLLVADPRSLLDASFQMTLLAVVSIGGIAVPLLQTTIHPYFAATRELRVNAINTKLTPQLAQFRLTIRTFASALESAGNNFIAWRIFPWSIRFLLGVAEMLVVSCVVELAMTLPMALYFHRITVFALPVNILILPLLAWLIPAALVTMLSVLLWPAVAVFPAVVVALLLHCGTGIVHLFGSLAWSNLRVPTPLLWQSAAFCAFLAAAILLARPVYSSRWPRRLAWVALVGAVAAALVPRPVQHPRNALLMEAIDVGQGDSLLLITPGGKTLLVDGGGYGGSWRHTSQNFDIGENVVSPTLWSRGIRHLDVVALTHAHSDHIDGLFAVLRNFHPAELWVGNNPHVAVYNSLLKEAAKLNIRVRSLRSGDTLTLGDARVKVLAPLPSYKPEAKPTNDDSLVLHVAYGATSVLLEGDAEAPIEKEMLGESGLRSTLLKVGHHGSTTSTRPAFLARVAPRWAVISCGLHNRYGLPDEKVLKELETAHVRTYSTDIDGAVCFSLNGKTGAEIPCNR